MNCRCNAAVIILYINIIYPHGQGFSSQAYDDLLKFQQ